MNEQYVIILQCFDTPEDCLGDFYLDMVNDCFDTKEKAEDVMNQCIEDELRCLNEDSGYDGEPYIRVGNDIKLFGSLITSYTIQKLNLIY